MAKEHMGKSEKKEHMGKHGKHGGFGKKTEGSAHIGKGHKGFGKEMASPAKMK